MKFKIPRKELVEFLTVILEDLVKDFREKESLGVLKSLDSQKDYSIFINELLNLIFTFFDSNLTNKDLKNIIDYNIPKYLSCLYGYVSEEVQEKIDYFFKVLFGLYIKFFSKNLDYFNKSLEADKFYDIILQHCFPLEEDGLNDFLIMRFKLFIDQLFENKKHIKEDNILKFLDIMIFREECFKESFDMWSDNKLFYLNKSKEH